MSPLLVIPVLVGYVVLLFGIAYYADRRAKQGRSVVNNSVVYSLSLAVFCTAWSFFGSIGMASASGIGFLPVSLGPVIFAPLWWMVWRKIVLISKHQRITSVVDFLASRYGKSVRLGVLGALLASVAVIPYISIQLKAMTQSFQYLAGGMEMPVIRGIIGDPGLYAAIALAVFSILFGTRKLDPNERHEGVVAAVSTDAVVKLSIFLGIGVFVTFGLFDGFGDLFREAWKREDMEALLDFEKTGIDGWSWFWLSLLSFFAVILLPRQFHVAVVENTSPAHIGRAMWLFPLYLLLLNIFVLPIAFAGKMLIPPDMADPDFYLLALSIFHGHPVLGLLAAIGGISAGASMVIVSTIALSIALSNNLVVPLFLRTAVVRSGRVLLIRRVVIALILILAYAFFRRVGQSYSLVTMGLVSFTAVAQFAPGIFLGLYWKRATRAGAFAGLFLGMLVWFYTLLLPTMAEVNLFGVHMAADGPWDISWLRPTALFGMVGVDNVTHSAFWSLLFNTGALVAVSLLSRQNTLEITQADLFVDIYKYRKGRADYEVIRRRASLEEVLNALRRFLGESRAEKIIAAYPRDLRGETAADADLINYAEAHLAGVVGSPSAKLIMRTIAEEDPISLEEMYRVLEQTQEAISYSRELEKTSEQLRLANEQLKELDRLKADFIATVTHELRTPITSIKSLSRILEENPALPDGQRKEFLAIIVSESERISRLINQVLDLERAGSEKADWRPEPVDLCQLIRTAGAGFRQQLDEKGVQLFLELPEGSVWVAAGRDPLLQVFINLISNAIKFCREGEGKITLGLERKDGRVNAFVRDNGIGIDPGNHDHIFDQFFQVSDPEYGKPPGSGLGLFISKRIVERFGGTIRVESKPGKGATFRISFPEERQ